MTTKILLIVIFWIAGFFKTLFWLKNYLQKLYKALKVVYLLAIIYMEYDNPKAMLVWIFIADFNLLSCE